MQSSNKIFLLLTFALLFSNLSATRRDAKGIYTKRWRPFDSVRHANKKRENRLRRRRLKDQGDSFGGCICTTIGVFTLLTFYTWVAMHERV